MAQANAEMWLGKTRRGHYFAGFREGVPQAAIFTRDQSKAALFVDEMDVFRYQSRLEYNFNGRRMKPVKVAVQLQILSEDIPL